MIQDARPPWDPGTSDGCSVPKLVLALFDGAEEFYAAIREECCVPHDGAYYQGGSDLDRLVADLTLYRDTLRVSRRALPAWSDQDIMLVAQRTFQAVRSFGGSHWHYPDGSMPEPAPDLREARGREAETA